MYNYYNESSRLLHKELMKFRNNIKLNLDAPDGDIFSKYSDDFSDEDSETKATDRHYYYDTTTTRE